MNQESYQKMKEGFERYLKSRSYTRRGIKSRMTVFNIYIRWVENENIEIEQVTYNDLLVFMKWCSNRGIKQRSVQNYMGTVKHLYDYFIQQGQAEKNPATDIKVKGVKRKILYRILAPHELHAIYNNYTEDTPIGTRNKAMIGLLINQGLRTGELARLKVKDINLREGKVTVPGSRKTDGRELTLQSHQVMDFYDYVLKAREEILEESNRDEKQPNRLFISQAGNGHNINNIMVQVITKIRRINPQVINAKQIRASVITRWLKKYNLRQVQYLAGHRYISSTEKYLQNDMEGLLEEIQKYHPLG